MPAPIILFVYNRPDHTKQTVETLVKNDLAGESDLFVFADGIKENATQEQRNLINLVREYIHTITGFKSITIEESEGNKGLANSVIAGVTKIINKYGRAIVVEDDIITHPYFLRYMNTALDLYENDKRIYMVGGYNQKRIIPKLYTKDLFIIHRSCSWGWATWKNRWGNSDWNVTQYEKIKYHKALVRRFNRGGNDMFHMLAMQMKGEIDSWAIRWDYAMFLNNAYAVLPCQTLVHNIGFDGSGVHCGSIDEKITMEFPTMPDYHIVFPKRISRNLCIEHNFKREHGGIHCQLIEFGKRIVRTILAKFHRHRS